MKKNLKAWLYIVALLLITSCDKERDYRMTIPADAGMVWSMNVGAMVEKVRDEGEAEQAEIEAFLKENIDASMYDYVANLIKNPKESGLDWSSPVYFYSTASGEVGFVVKVSDEEKVTNLFEKLNEQEIVPALESEDGAHILSLDKQTVVSFDESALLLLLNTGSSVSPVEKSIALLTQKEEQSFLSKKSLFKAFESRKGDMTGVMSYEAMIPAQSMGMLKNMLPENPGMSDVHLLFSLRFENGKIVAQGEDFYMSEVAKEWVEKNKKITMPQKGLFLPQGNSVFWMGMGLKGEKMFDMLMEFPLYAQQMKPMEPVFRKLFSAIEGDVAVSMPVMLPGKIALNLNMELKKGQETDFMTTVSGLLQGIGVPLSATGNQTYHMALPGMNLNFGLDAEKHFYLTARNTDSSATGVASGDWTKEVEGHLLYCRFDINALSDLLVPFMAGQRNIQCISLFDYICAKTNTPESVNLEVVMKNRDENVLKQIVDIVKSLDE